MLDIPSFFLLNFYEAPAFFFSPFFQSFKMAGKAGQKLQKNMKKVLKKNCHHLFDAEANMELKTSTGRLFCFGAAFLPHAT